MEDVVRNPPFRVSNIIMRVLAVLESCTCTTTSPFYEMRYRKSQYWKALAHARNINKHVGTIM
jgi:hypothetical protein